MTMRNGYHWTRKPLLGYQIDWSHPLSVGMLSCLSFNESGGKPFDIINPSRNSWAVTGTSWAYGKYGPALSFNGTSDAMQLTYGIVQIVPLTMACWFNTKQLGSLQTMMGVMPGNGNLASLQLNVTSTGQVEAKATQGDGSSEKIDTVTTASTGTWNHAAAVFYSGGAGRTTYLNGLGIFDSTSGLGPQFGTNWTSVGAHHNASDLYDQFFNGSLGLAVFWNRALTDSEIEWLYDEPFTFFRRPNVSTYLPSAFPSNYKLAANTGSFSLTFEPATLDYQRYSLGYFIRSTHKWLNKPLLGYGIDLTHPLAEGLKGCWLFNEGNGVPYNLVDGSSASIGSNLSWQGDGLVWDGTTTTNGSMDTGLQVPLTNGLTIFAWALRLTDNNVANTVTMFTAAYTGGTISCQFNNGYRWIQNHTIVSNAGLAREMELHAISIQPASGGFMAASTYFNGVQDGTDSQFASGLTSPSSSIKFPDWTLNGQTGPGWVMVAQGVYDRALTADEIAWLYQEPYAYMKGPAVRSFVVTSTAPLSYSFSASAGSFSLTGETSSGQYRRSAGAYYLRSGRQWSNKPLLGFPIDWGHPLAEGLSRCWLLNEGGGQTSSDLAVSDIANFSSGVAWSADSLGPCLKLSGSDFASTDFRLPTTQGVAWSVTIAVSGNTNASFLWTQGQDSALIYEAGPPAYLALNNASASAGGNNGFACTLDGARHFITVSFPTGWSLISDAQVYLDGVPLTATYNTTAFGVSGDPFYIGGRSSGTSGWVGDVGLCFIHDRAITAAEAEWLAQDPFAFVQLPKYRRYLITTTVPTAYVLDAATGSISESGPSARITAFYNNGSYFPGYGHRWTNKPPLGYSLIRSHELAKGLVSCLAFNEGGGQVVNDLLDPGYNWSVTGTSWSVGRDGPALSFNGTSDYLQQNHGVANAIPVTLMTWFNTSSLASQQVLLNLATGGGSVAFLALQIETTGQVSAVTNDGGNGTKTATSNVSVATGTWNQAAAVFNNEFLRSVYVNGGNRVDNILDSLGPQFGIFYTAVGAFHNATDTLQSFFNGSLGMAMIWNRALTAEEIAWLYQEPYAIFRTSNQRTFTFHQVALPDAEFNHPLPAATGSFAKTGGAANSTITMPGGTGAVSLTGKPVSFITNLAGQYTISVLTGSFVETGEAAILDYGSPAAFGSFVQTAFAAGMEVSLTAAFGSFTETGEAASLFGTLAMTAAFGSFTETGEAASYGGGMAATTGSFVETGEAAPYSLLPATATGGSFTLTGKNALFAIAEVATSGSFTDTPSDSTVNITRSSLGGSFVLTGEPAILVPPHALAGYFVRNGLHWTTKPGVGYGINWSHQLANGLVGCWLFNEYGGGTSFNLVNGKASTLGSNLSWAPGGILWDGTTTTNASMDTGLQHEFQSFTGLSHFVWLIRHNTANEFNNNLVFTATYGGSPVYFGHVSQNFFLGGNNHSIFVSEPPSNEVPCLYVWSIWPGTGSAGSGNQPGYVYLNGQQAGSDSACGFSLTVPTATILAPNWSSNSATGQSYTILSQAIYNRPLTGDEAAWLYQDPYAFIRPPNYRSYLVLMNGAGGNVSYTLTANVGSFVETGETANFDVGCTAAQGSFTLTGEPATLTASYTLVAAQGSFTLTGKAANLSAQLGTTLVADFGTFTESGDSANMNISRATSMGTFTETGENATLSVQVGNVLSASSGAFVLTGETAPQNISRDSSAASFFETGESANLTVQVGTTLVANSGTFSLSRQLATFHWSLASGTGSLAESGLAAVLNVALAAGFASYSLAGQGASFGRSLASLGGSYSLVGEAAVMWAGPVALIGTFSVAGQNSTFLLDKSSSDGLFTFTGNSANLTVQIGASLLANTGGFALTGVADSFALLKPATTGFVTENGEAAILDVEVQASFAYYLESEVPASAGYSWASNMGAVSETAPDAAFAMTLTAASGSFNESGLPSQLHYFLVGDVVSFSETGYAGQFAIALPAACGQIIEMPQNVSANVGVSAAPGDLTLLGGSVQMSLFRFSGTGLLAETGEPVYFQTGIAVGVGNFGLVRELSTFDFSLSSATGILVESGQNADLIDLGKVLSASVGNFELIGMNGMLSFVFGEPSVGFTATYKYRDGTVVYSASQASKGKLEAVAIKSVRLVTSVKTGGQTVVLYVDKRNGLWNEDELCDEAEARSLAIAALQARQQSLRDRIQKIQ